MSLILIVDDEPDLAATLEYNLSRDGFDTLTAPDGRTALDLARAERKPDLIILDVMLPGISGLEVCRQLRADARTKTIPILMLTARGDEVDRVVGFTAGADDYVVKPFSTHEITLRVRAILRRTVSVPPGEDALVAGVFGVLRIDPDSHRAWVSGEELHLTPLEFRLLATFISRRGKAQSRDTLLKDVWGMSGEPETRTVDTHVKRLREKLGNAGQYIETVRGIGYRFEIAGE